MKRNTPLRKMSKNKAKDMKEYYGLRREALENAVCEFPITGSDDPNGYQITCLKPATEVHHSAGRHGQLLVNKRYWWLLCRDHHKWIHDNMKEARRRGLVLIK